MTTWTSDELNKVGEAEELDPTIYEQIDAAYRTKYRRYAAGIVNTTLSSEARAATIKLVPRSIIP